MATLHFSQEQGRIIIPSLAFASDDLYTQGLQIYCVGGVVRDALLGLVAGDHDWVVVGSSPEEMMARGFVPVGGDFPVFLHPVSKEEYALARTERKSGRGYQGFTFYTGMDVTLAEDLQRRDFTVNAMATDAYGFLYDPYRGFDDLQAGCFRHVSQAFIEDPVRILRLGRFLSRFDDFDVAPETLVLCRQMVLNREIDALVAERVWKEVSRALMNKKPSRFFNFLAQINGLEKVLPGLCWQEDLQALLDSKELQGLDLSQRYALLALGSDALTLSNRLKVTREQADYAKYLPMVCEALGKMGDDNSDYSWACTRVQFVEYFDGVRKPERLLALVKVALLLEARQNEQDVTAHFEQWQQLIHVIKSVPVGDIAKRYAPDVNAIKTAIHQARVVAALAVKS